MEYETDELGILTDKAISDILSQTETKDGEICWSDVKELLKAQAEATKSNMKVLDEERLLTNIAHMFNSN